MARARDGGSELLKIPEPTNTPSTPSCISRDTSAGVAENSVKEREGVVSETSQSASKQINTSV